MATIGRSRAVAEIGKIRLSGFIAWLTWLLVHIYYLVDFRNRTHRHHQLGLVLSDLPARGAADHGPRSDGGLVAGASRE
jgi:hypothetical protein